MTNKGRGVARLDEVKIAGGMATCTALPTDAHPRGRPLAPGEEFSAPVVSL